MIKIDKPLDFFREKLENFVVHCDACGISPSLKKFLAYDSVFVLFQMEKILLPLETLIRRRDEVTLKKVFAQMGNITIPEFSVEHKDKTWRYLDFFCDFIIALRSKRNL